jgi:hypothetical protein
MTLYLDNKWRPISLNSHDSEGLDMKKPLLREKGILKTTFKLRESIEKWLKKEYLFLLDFDFGCSWKSQSPGKSKKVDLFLLFFKGKAYKQTTLDI